ncbi:hypothetical protein SEA_ATUIN_150 [Arthrobacter phage Atuin]|nr:hypothetical protein SEA_ATUIN_249 [Arthrobacter phage Atuin]
MATAKQVEKELLEWHNAQYTSVVVDSEENEDYDEYDYDEDIAEYFDYAWGRSERSIYEHLYWWGGNSKKPVIEIPSGKVSIKEDVGGEDQGSTRFVILSVNDQFFKVNGYYASWDGDNWDDAHLVEVEPRDVVVVQYFEKGK